MTCTTYARPSFSPRGSELAGLDPRRRRLCGVLRSKRGCILASVVRKPHRHPRPGSHNLLSPCPLVASATVSAVARRRSDFASATNWLNQERILDLFPEIHAGLRRQYPGIVQLPVALSAGSDLDVSTHRRSLRRCERSIRARTLLDRPPGARCTLGFEHMPGSYQPVPRTTSIGFSTRWRDLFPLQRAGTESLPFLTLPDSQSLAERPSTGRSSTATRLILK